MKYLPQILKSSFEKIFFECCTVVVGFSYFIHPNIICCTFFHHYIDHCVMLHILHVVTRCYQKDYFPSSTHFVCYLFTCWIPVKYLAVLMSVSIKWKFECDLFLSSDTITHSLDFWLHNCKWHTTAKKSF